eukprot:8173752-Pyramimonas_sp.AAC.2
MHTGWLTAHGAQALRQWGEGSAQAEDACFNRCPPHSKCNERVPKCECEVGFEWVGSADARTGLCRKFVRGGDDPKLVNPSKPK